MQYKISPHDFFWALHCSTMYGFSEDSKDRYREFMLVERQFNFLQDLRWNHMGADEVLPVGSLVLNCPACLQPNVNMDPLWMLCVAALM